MNLHTRSITRGASFVLLLAIGATALGQTNIVVQRAGDDVMRRGGNLHDAAISAGGHYSTSVVDTDGMMEYLNVKSLARDSDIVLVGIPLRNVCKLSADGQDVFTYYTIRVEEGIKGHFKAGDELTVALPGGMYGWPDGTTARVSAPNFRKMVNGFRYVLYLRETGDRSHFRPTGGSQGVFELKDDGTVLPHARFKDTPLGKIRGKAHQDFMDDVRRSVRGDTE